MSAFIEERRADFGVEPICRALGVSASAYYRRKTGGRSARAQEDERLLELIRTEHKRNWEAYGYRRMWKHLLRLGESAPRCQVQRLMRAHAIQGAKRRGKPWRTTRSDADARPLPDLLQRDFSAERPNARWVADFTYVRCFEGVVFFAFILDVFSRMLVGWRFAAQMRTELVEDALQMAVAAGSPDPGLELVHHSDRGSQYTSGDFTGALAEHDIPASVGSTGDAYDNAMAESFVDTFKTELISDRRWRSRAALELAIVQWVGWYNNDRLHGELGDIPPVELEHGAGPSQPSTPPPIWWSHEHPHELLRGLIGLAPPPALRACGSAGPIHIPSYSPTNQAERSPSDPVRLTTITPRCRGGGCGSSLAKSSWSSAPSLCRCRHAPCSFRRQPSSGSSVTGSSRQEKRPTKEGRDHPYVGRRP